MLHKFQNCTVIVTEYIVYSMTVQFVKLLTRLLEPHLKQVCLLAKLLAVQPRHTQSPGRISRLSPLALSAPHWSDLTFSVFRRPHLPLDTPFWTRGFPLVMRSLKAGFPFATRARKREPCLHRYVSRMTRTENFLSQFFFKVFLETTFLHV